MENKRERETERASLGHKDRGDKVSCIAVILGLVAAVVVEHFSHGSLNWAITSTVHSTQKASFQWKAFKLL